MSAVSSNSSVTLATREQVVALLEILATRMQWAAARPIISSTSIHVSRGWQETIDGAKEGVYSDAIWNSAYAILADVLNKHTYVGNKKVSIFDLRETNEDIKNNLYEWIISSANTNLLPIVGKRPFNVLSAPVTKSGLEPYKKELPILIDVSKIDEKLHLQFFSARPYIHRESLDISKMTSAQKKAFSDYEELIGVKTKLIPCFDTIVIDCKNDLLEVRVDFQPGMVEDKEISAFARVVGEMNRITEKFIGRSAASAGLMNFHPVIAPLYKDEGCGRVTALGFVATGKSSASNNHGQIHRTKTKDFRKDEFHVGGKKSVDRIDPYAIGVTWQSTSAKNDLVLELKGSVRALYGGKLSSVTTAEVVGCLDRADFDFVIGQVLSRINRREK